MQTSAVDALVSSFSAVARLNAVVLGAHADVHLDGRRDLEAVILKRAVLVARRVVTRRRRAHRVFAQVDARTVVIAQAATV